MARKKLQKYQEIQAFPTFIPREKAMSLRGRWKECLGGKKRLVVELGCGKGTFLLHYAQANPGDLCIGIDRKGDRLWAVAKEAIKRELTNIYLLWINIEYLGLIFGEGEVDVFWLLFPDPFPKRRQAKRRLVHPRFLKLYQKVSRQGAKLFLKTDSKVLADWAKEAMAKTGIPLLWERFPYEPSSEDPPHFQIITPYEAQFRHQGIPIYFACFRLSQKR